MSRDRRDRDRARTRFAEDQTAAALAQAEDTALTGMAASLIVPVIFRYDLAHLRAYDRGAEARFNAYFYHDPDARFCTHLAGSAQLHWYLVPGCPVGCPPCVDAWMTANVGAGTAEDTRCDICRAGPNAPGTFDQRRLIIRVGAPPGQPAPVCTITYLVCAACMAKEPR
jgi:hypothetical protein